LAEAFGRFGFGHSTGLGLPGERSGMLRPVEKWGDIGFANVSFGQGVTATPLQIVSGLASIAAGGVYHPPRIVARVVRPDGTTESLPERPAVRVISERAAKQMTGIMLGVTEQGGTARAAAIDGYPVAGKTGTAQKVSGGHYDSSKWVSSFIGFAPAQEPRVAIAVMVDEPQGGHLGGAVAAPVFKEIAEQALRYLHVPPQAQPVAAKVPERGKAEARSDGKRSRSSEADDGADDELPGSDVAELRDADLDNGDEAAPPAPAPAGVIAAAVDDAEADDADAPPSQVTIPNFRGLTIAAALRVARQSGVQLAFDEERAPMGVALAQAPGPGPAQRGVVCRVSFGRTD
jgi:membrane peptidoglycan carboxypeptidase